MENLCFLKIVSDRENPLLLELDTKTSVLPSLSSSFIIRPFLSKFRYPGNGVNTDSNPGFPLIEYNALRSHSDGICASTIICKEVAGFSNDISLEIY